MYAPYSYFYGGIMGSIYVRKSDRLYVELFGSDYAGEIA
jgi:hypothetical protein